MIKPRPTYDIKQDERAQLNKKPSIWNFLLGANPPERQAKVIELHKKPEKRYKS